MTSLMNFSFLWLFIVASDILALRLCATLLSSQYFDVTCDLLRRLSKDDTKQDYYWLKEEKYTCCSCNTNFRAFLYRTSQNNDVKSPNFRYLRQHEHITMKQSFSVSAFLPVLYKVNCEILAIAIVIFWTDVFVAVAVSLSRSLNCWKNAARQNGIYLFIMHTCWNNRDNRWRSFNVSCKIKGL